MTATPFFRGLLDTAENREAIMSVVTQFVPSAQLDLLGDEVMTVRSEEEETSVQAPPETASSKMENKVIDMFNGEKLK